MNERVRIIPENGMMVADEMVGLLGNPVRGKAEAVELVAQFTSLEAARAYEKASRLREPEKIKGYHTLGGQGPWPLVEENDYVYILTYREGSLLRWFNQIPEHYEGFFRASRFVKLRWFEPQIPIDPEPPI